MRDKQKKTPDTNIFKNREKEATFWEGHFDEAFTEGNSLNLTVEKNLSKGITIRLNTESLDQLRKLAQKKGIGPTTLARMWILEQLQQRDQLSHS